MTKPCCLLMLSDSIRNSTTLATLSTKTNQRKRKFGRKSQSTPDLKVYFSQICKKIWCILDGKQAADRWQNIRSEFKKKIPSGDEAKSAYIYAEQLEFLRPFLQSRPRFKNEFFSIKKYFQFEYFHARKRKAGNGWRASRRCFINNKQNKQI